MKADKAEVSRLLKTARGQIDGVLKMVDEDKYFIDIVTQLMASNAVIRKAARVILHSHISSCVLGACEAGDAQEKEKKINELLDIICKLTK